MNSGLSYAGYERTEVHEFQVLVVLFLNNSKTPAQKGACHSGWPLWRNRIMHTSQKDFREFSRCLFFRKLNKVHFGKVQANGVIINRADKGLHRDVGIATIESALALSTNDVVTQKPEERTNLQLAIFLRKLMTLER